MQSLTYRPPPPLAEFVDVLWLYQREAQPHAKERLLPMGTMELVIDLTHDAWGPLLCGAHSESFEIHTSEPVLVLGVHFKPGGGFPFLNLPAGELHNATAPLEALWGRKASEFQERVLEARTPVAKFAALKRVLIEQATRPLARHPAVDFALKEFHSPHVRTVSEVIDKIGLSPRRFIELFRNEVGLTPKLYRRIHRFQQLLQRVHGTQRIDWAQAAVDLGYYDQAHFIREFRDFSGLSPTAYLQARTEHLNHVPLFD